MRAVVKGKFCRTRYRALGPQPIQVYTGSHMQSPQARILPFAQAVSPQLTFQAIHPAVECHCFRQTFG